jgi:hypothetical protein
VDLSSAVVLTHPGAATPVVTAATVLIEELARRGVTVQAASRWPAQQPVIVVATTQEAATWNRNLPPANAELAGPEAFRLYVQTVPGHTPVVWVLGSGPRGALFGVGALLRSVDYTGRTLTLAGDLDWTSAPAYAIRGHQLGYRAQANSYDGWNAAQFEQYIRELAFFGVNSIEAIPFQDERPTPVMKFPRRAMNKALGEICQRYGLDYWAWIPADFDLTDQAKCAHLLDQCDQFFRDTPTLTAVSFPGGDPGDNPPQLVFPFLEEMATRLCAAHPQARIWPSLQQYSPDKVDFCFDYIRTHMPAWMGGLVTGPGSPPSNEMRNRLPARYPLRHYPDLSHNVRCQYEVPNWDQAFAITEGRECVNPRAVEYAKYFHAEAGYSDGFISYSDGVHDDVNKIVWSALSWNPQLTVPEILLDYARVYFTPAVAVDARDGILALERNWAGALLPNGSVEDNLLRWQQLETRAPQLAGNWRWQMYLLRANYDAFLRRKLAQETPLELEANAKLLQAPKLGSAMATQQAKEALQRCETQPAAAALRSRIVDLCADLFRSIVLQTSVEKYFAINSQRGAVLDFIDLPLNNRWWLEDELDKAAKLPSESQRTQRLHELATWEHPGPGSSYDCVGNLDKSPHVVRCALDPGTPAGLHQPGTTVWWWDSGKSRARLTWQISTWPAALIYNALDPEATYVIRTTGYGHALPRINGDPVKPTLGGTEMGQFKEFPVPPQHVRSRRLTVTWDPVPDEEKLNWRKRSRVSEVWLLKQ